MIPNAVEFAENPRISCVDEEPSSRWPWPPMIFAMIGCSEQQEPRESSTSTDAAPSQKDCTIWAALPKPTFVERSLSIMLPHVSESSRTFHILQKPWMKTGYAIFISRVNIRHLTNMFPWDMFRRTPNGNTRLALVLFSWEAS